jgi:small subunit ribosomal protein S12
MATVKHSARRIKVYYRKRSSSRTPALQKRPQVKGIVTKVTIKTPKKPNSARRHVGKVNLTNKKRVTARLPGSGYLCSRYNRVLVNGGRANDLPGVGYTLIRGKFDFIPYVGKRKRRSVYGVRRPDGFTKHIRRCFRKFYL